MTAILAIDQGTTSSRAIIFDAHGQVLGVGQQPFTQHYPADGWVEHDPEEIWQTTLASMRQALQQAGVAAAELAVAGITNQRETTLVWERASGQPIYPAIVWQDRRTADRCEALRQAGHEPMLQQQTGLLLDPYFSASKIAWILDNVAGARQRAEAGELAFGTVDTYLLWRLSNGKEHKTDATNASRTALFDISRQCWSDDLLAMFDVPAALLPEVCDSVHAFGSINAQWLGAEVPIGGIMGDQQAALFGQACLQPGQIKSTYGTGCFVMAHTGTQLLRSEHRLLSTVAARLQGTTYYALEGSIFNAGTIMQWLRDELGFIADSGASEAIAQRTGVVEQVYLVPAFTGLGAPYWDPHARGALLGLTRDTSADQIVVAGLQAVAYQTRDLIDAMAADGVPVAKLRVDGGMTQNQWLLQFLADTLAVPVQRPAIGEITALGAALAAGLQAGVYPDLTAINKLWAAASEHAPAMAQAQRQRLYAGWQRAVGRVR